jgi:hypothetical protein
MSIPRVLTCLWIVALTGSALAAEFYIVQEPGTTRCTITERPPAPGTGTIIGDGAYGDRATAEAEMRRIAACAQAPRLR